jgi:hypothetical protein
MTSANMAQKINATMMISPAMAPGLAHIDSQTSRRGEIG